MVILGFWFGVWYNVVLGLVVGGSCFLVLVFDCFCLDGWFWALVVLIGGCCLFCFYFGWVWVICGWCNGLSCCFCCFVVVVV